MLLISQPSHLIPNNTFLAFPRPALCLALASALRLPPAFAVLSAVSFPAVYLAICLVLSSALPCALPCLVLPSQGLPCIALPCLVLLCLALDRGWVDLWTLGASN